VLPIWASLWTDTVESWKASLPRAGRALAQYASQPNIPVRQIGGLLFTAHSMAEKAELTTEKSAGKTIHGLRMPMHAGMMDAHAFAQVVTSINEALQASTEALFR
jgi:hypothetical protein